MSVRSDLKKLDSFTLEMSKNHLNRNFLPNGRMRVKNEKAIAYLTVKSTTETFGVGTRKAIPVIFPLSSGITFVQALAAPVEAGIMLEAPPRASLQL